MMIKFLSGGVIAALLGATSLANAGDHCTNCFVRQVTPAHYQTVPTNVVVRKSRQIVHRIPAQYQTVAENVLVRPERVVRRQIPAVVRESSERVLLEPARREWQTRRDAYGRDVLCEVTVPARYGTAIHQDVVAPARVEEVVVPAVYRQRARRVLVEPARSEVTWTTPEVHTIPTLVQVAPASERWVRTTNPDYQPVSAFSGRY